MTKPVSIFFTTAFGIIFLSILAPAITTWLKPIPSLPQIAPAPVFELTDSNGQAFSSKSLVGKVWVANFFFTSCQGPCPIQSAAMAKVAQRFKSARNVEFISITVDPETDTPIKLEEYAGKFNADPKTWHFLTGPKSVIVDLLNSGFKLGSLEDPKFHSTRFILVDKNGTIRGYYQGTEAESVTKLIDDLPSLS